jgi:hypothetical protein
MAKYSDKNGKSRKPEKPHERPFTFINYRLSAEDQEWLRACDTGVDFPLTHLLVLVEEGYKFSLSNDSKNSTYVASITDRLPNSEYQNYCLTGRGASPLDAWVALAYRHAVVGRDGWGQFIVLDENEPPKYS